VELLKFRSFKNFTNELLKFRSWKEVQRMTIGEKVKEYVQERGIKQRFLAEKVGVDDSKISKFLNGTQDIGVLEYFKLCEALDVPMEKFIKE
jgi:plasmid maintenance system antidote protein VapI